MVVWGFQVLLHYQGGKLSIHHGLVGWTQRLDNLTCTGPREVFAQNVDFLDMKTCHQLYFTCHCQAILDTENPKQQFRYPRIIFWGKTPSFSSPSCTLWRFTCVWPVSEITSTSWHPSQRNWTCLTGMSKLKLKFTEHIHSWDLEDEISLGLFGLHVCWWLHS